MFSEKTKGLQLSEKDTGSSAVQISILTEKISHLTDHLKVHKKDEHTRQGLLRMVNSRRKLLNYLKLKDLDLYKKVISVLSLRK